MPKESTGGWRSEKIRRPREEVQPFVDLLVSEMPTGIEYHLLGSWRRGALVIGDIEVLLVTPNGELNGSLFEPGVALPPSVDWQRQGPKVAQGDLWIGDQAIHIDLVLQAQRARRLPLLRNRPVELNMVQRQRAIRMGYALSQIGLLDRETKRQLDNGIEEDIYRWLGLDYLTPEQREKWTKPKKATPKPYPQQPRQTRGEAMNGAQKAAMTRANREKREAAVSGEAVPAGTESQPTNDTPINVTPTKAAPRKTAAPKASRAAERDQAWSEAPDPEASAAQATAEVTKVEEKKDEPRLEIGGVEVTLSEAKEALVLLARAKSMFVKQPLAQRGHKLAATDYHGVAALGFTANPELKKQKHPTKTAFIEVVKNMIAAVEGETK